MYDFDLDKTAKNKITKDHIIREDPRFINDSIYGDTTLFNTVKYGNPIFKLLDKDKALSAQYSFSKKKIRDQRSFDKYIDGNITMFQTKTGAVHIDNIPSTEKLQRECLKSMSAYK